MKTNYLKKWWAVALMMLTVGVAQVSAQDVNIPMSTTARTTNQTFGDATVGIVTVTSPAVGGSGTQPRYWQDTNNAIDFNSQVGVTAPTGKYIARIEFDATGNSGAGTMVGAMLDGNNQVYEQSTFSVGTNNNSNPAVSTATLVAPPDANITRAHYGRANSANGGGSGQTCRVYAIRIWYKPSCTAIETNFNVTASQPAVCSGVAEAAIGLSGSEVGVTYQLYRSTTAVGDPVEGDGDAIDFGLFAEGVYSVKGYGTGGDFCEDEVAMAGTVTSVEVAVNSDLCTEPLIIVDTTSLDFGVVKAGSEKTLSFFVTGMNLNDPISIDYSGVTGFSGVATAAADAKDFEIEVTFDGSADASGVITLSSGDADEKEIAVSATIDGTAPTAGVTTPSGQTVALNSPITVTFSEDIQVVNPAGITVDGSQASTSITDNVLTINTPLAYCTEYTVSVTAGAIADKVGNVTTAATNISFRTVGMPGGFSDPKTIMTYAQDGDAILASLQNEDFTTSGRSTLNIRTDGSEGSCADYTQNILRVVRYEGNNAEMIMTFPKGVGSVTIEASATGTRTGTLSTSAAGVDAVSGSARACNTFTVAPNTNESTTVTFAIDGSGDTQIKSIIYTVPQSPLMSNGEEIQEVEQGAAIEEIIFTGGYAVPQISSEDETKLEGIGLVVNNDGTGTLNIFGTINANAASGIYTYEVTIDECTDPIQGSIEVIAAPEPLTTFVMKWSDNAVISGGKTETGSITVAELSTDRQDKMEVYFNFAEGYKDCFLVVNGVKYERVDIEWQGSVVGQGAYIDFGSNGANDAIVQVVRPDSAPQASKGLQRAAGDTNEFGTVVAEYTLNIQSVGTGSNDINAKDKEVKDCFNVLGVQVDCESNGIVIKRFTDGSSEKTLKK